jgi:hypothetical protein
MSISDGEVIEINAPTSKFGISNPFAGFGEV